MKMLLVCDKVTARGRRAYIVPDGDAGKQHDLTTETCVVIDEGAAFQKIWNQPHLFTYVPLIGAVPLAPPLDLVKLAKGVELDARYEAAIESALFSAAKEDVWTMRDAARAQYASLLAALTDAADAAAVAAIHWNEG